MTMVDEYLSRAAKRTVAHEKMSRSRLQDMEHGSIVHNRTQTQLNIPISTDLCSKKSNNIIQACMNECLYLFTRHSLINL